MLLLKSASCYSQLLRGKAHNLTYLKQKCLAFQLGLTGHSKFQEHSVSLLLLRVFIPSSPGFQTPTHPCKNCATAFDAESPLGDPPSQSLWCLECTMFLSIQPRGPGTVTFWWTCFLRYIKVSISANLSVYCKIQILGWVLMAHTFNPSTQDSQSYTEKTCLEKQEREGRREGRREEGREGGREEEGEREERDSNSRLLIVYRV